MHSILYFYQDLIKSNKGVPQITLLILSATSRDRGIPPWCFLPTRTLCAAPPLTKRASARTPPPTRTLTIHHLLQRREDGLDNAVTLAVGASPAPRLPHPRPRRSTLSNRTRTIGRSEMPRERRSFLFREHRAICRLLHLFQIVRRLSGSSGSIRKRSRRAVECSLRLRGSGRSPNTGTIAAARLCLHPLACPRLFKYSQKVSFQRNRNRNLNLNLNRCSSRM